MRTEYCTEYLSVLRYCSEHFIYSWWCSLFRAICCAWYCFSAPLSAAAPRHSYCSCCRSIIKAFRRSIHSYTAIIRTIKRTGAKKNLNEKRAIYNGLRVYLGFSASVFLLLFSFSNFWTFIHTIPIPTRWLWIVDFLWIMDCFFLRFYMWTVHNF